MNSKEALDILGFENEFEKAIRSGLVQKQIWIVRNGKPHMTTTWVRPTDEPNIKDQAKNVPAGESIADVFGMNISRYSEKAVLVSGDTYANKEALQAIKKEIGVGTFNRKLKGWVFPSKFLSSVLGGIMSIQSDDDKAATITNQKNSLDVGTEVDVSGEKGSITANASDKDGIKYNVKTKDGELNGVDEKVIDVPPVTDDKKISEIINEANESNRAKTAKQLYGMKAIEDIHKYSLSEYMGMHGISQDEIDAAVSSLTKPKSESKGSSSSSSGERKAPTVGNTKGLTKKQLIAKLVYAHYQAVSKAVDAGEKIEEKTLATYPDLKEAYDLKRQAMSEETKRKISEALKKNGPEEVPEPKKEPVETDKERTDRLRREAATKLGLDPNITKEGVDKMLAEGRAKMKKQYEANAAAERKKKEQEAQDALSANSKGAMERLAAENERIAAEKAAAATKAEAQAAAEKFINGMSEDQLSEMKSVFKKAKGKVVVEEQGKLAELISNLEKTKAERIKVKAKEKDSQDYKVRSELSSKGMNLRGQEIKMELAIRGQKNIVSAVQNGGTISEITDDTGVVHSRVANFVDVPSGDIVYDIATIRTDERPNYIPDIDRTEFRRAGFTFDSVRVGPNQYMVATNSYRENGLNVSGGYGSEALPYDTDEPAYAILTLDQLVLTQDYYTTLEKAEMEKQRDEANQRGLDHWNNMTDGKKERYMMQKNIYNGLPAKLRKTISKEDFESLTWQEREKIYKPIKKHGLKRLKTRFNDNTMASSFHSMYERFVNKDAIRTTKDGTKLRRGQSNYGISYAHRDGSNSWNEYREMLDWKINDLRVQREEISEIRATAFETSYGHSNTNDILKKDLGIDVKRQNGSDIKPEQIEQLKNAWESVQGQFGPLKKMAQDDSLVLSHAGSTYMYASKAVGVYVPSMKAIGVTAKYGEDDLGFTLGHEVAHWIDNTVGTKTGNSRFASDNYESTAGKIAIGMRKGMNGKTDSKYLNSSHECFARALEQYHAVESNEGDAKKFDSSYFAHANYMPKHVYDQVKPLIENFLLQNKHILKSIKTSMSLEMSKAFDILQA